MEKEKYMQEAYAYMLGTKKEERTLCGVRLWRNSGGI